MITLGDFSKETAYETDMTLLVVMSSIGPRQIIDLYSTERCAPLLTCELDIKPTRLWLVPTVSPGYAERCISMALTPFMRGPDEEGAGIGTINLQSIQKFCDASGWIFGEEARALLSQARYPESSYVR